MQLKSCRIRGILHKIAATGRNYKRKQLTNKYKSYYLDDLSQGLILARLNYCENYKLKILLSSYLQLGYDQWEIPELDTYSEDKIFYLLGEGDRYEYCALLLRHSKYSNRFKMIGTDITAWENAGSDIVLISIMSDKVLQRERNKELKKKYEGRIVHVTPYAGILIGFPSDSWQYFDMFFPKKDEVFVNAGAFQGETDIDFVKWAKGQYKKIYAFEPMKANIEICRQNYTKNNISNIELISKGTWSETGYITFSGSENQGHADANGTNRIETIKIDDAVSNLEEKVTFIKMDIEGAELKALQGARETILKDKPRMAICIYHKPEDLYEIPGYILSLVPEYRFKVRQYTSMTWETVLYAAVENEW